MPDTYLKAVGAGPRTGELCIGGSLDGQRAPRVPDDLRHLVRQPEYELSAPYDPDFSYSENVEVPPRELYRLERFRWGSPGLEMRLWVESAVPSEEISQRMYDLFKAGIAALEREREDTPQHVGTAHREFIAAMRTGRWQPRV